MRTIIAGIVALSVVSLAIGGGTQLLVGQLNAETTGQRIALVPGAYGMVRPESGSEPTTRVEILRVAETTSGGSHTWAVQVRLQNGGANPAPVPDFSLQLDNGKPAAQAFITGEAPLVLTDQAPVFGGPLAAGGGTRSSPPGDSLPWSMVRIDPSRSVQGWLRFTIPEGTKPAHLRVTPGIGVSGNLSFDLP